MPACDILPSISTRNFLRSQQVHCFEHELSWRNKQSRTVMNEQSTCDFRPLSSPAINKTTVTCFTRRATTIHHHTSSVTFFLWGGRKKNRPWRTRTEEGDVNRHVSLLGHYAVSTGKQLSAFRSMVVPSLSG